MHSSFLLFLSPGTNLAPKHCLLITEYFKMIFRLSGYASHFFVNYVYFFVFFFFTYPVWLLPTTALWPLVPSTRSRNCTSAPYRSTSLPGLSSHQILSQNWSSEEYFTPFLCTNMLHISHTCSHSPHIPRFAQKIKFFQLLQILKPFFLFCSKSKIY